MTQTIHLVAAIPQPWRGIIVRLNEEKRACEEALRRLVEAAASGDGSAAYRDGAGVRLTAHPAYDYAVGVLSDPQE